MATFGNHITAFPGLGYEWAGLNTAPYQLAAYAAGFPGGTVTDLYCYVASHAGSGGTNMNLCLWTSGGTLVVASGTLAVGPGSGGNGGQAYQHAAITPVYVSPGNYYIGVWRDPAGSFETSWASGANFYSGNNTSPGNFNSVTSNSGNIGAYLAYNPGTIYVRRSGVWVSTQAFVHRSGSEVNGIPYVRRSGNWNPGQ